MQMSKSGQQIAQENTQMRKSGQQIAKENIRKLRSWIAERDAANDWKDYVRGDKLNRTEIAAEAGIGLAAFHQNPSVRETLRCLEARLAADNLILSPTIDSDTLNEPDSPSDQTVNKRIFTNMARSEARVACPNRTHATSPFEPKQKLSPGRWSLRQKAPESSDRFFPNWKA